MKTIKDYIINVRIKTIVIVILFVISVIGYIKTKENVFEKAVIKIEDRVSYLAKEVKNTKDDVKLLKIESVDVKVKLAIITTKLTNIELILVEIRSEMHKNKGNKR